MTEKLNELVAAFNRGSLDVPDGFLTPNTSYSLNGRSYESLVGGSPDDPLTRLLARGLAGYRTAAKVLMYALQGPSATVEQLSEIDGGGGCRATVRVDGRLRPGAAIFTLRLQLCLIFDGNRVRSVEVTGAESDFALIHAARG